MAPILSDGYSAMSHFRRSIGKTAYNAATSTLRSNHASANKTPSEIRLSEPTVCLVG
jgi:hypothetical protein